MTDQDPEARMREKAREVAVRWVNRGLSDGDGDLLVQEFTQAFLEVVREATANNPFVAFYESGEQPGMRVCQPCLNSDHLHCVDRLPWRRSCICDTCAQIRKDAEDDMARDEPSEDDD